jgi:flagellar export protein FliJ
MNEGNENINAKGSSRSLGLLARLAENKVQASMHRITELQKAQAKIDAQREQLVKLKDDYSQQLAALTIDKGLVQAQGLRRFIQNLLALEERLDIEAQSLLEKAEAAQQALRDAQLQKRKMESLVERQEVKTAKEKSIVDQRALDAVGIARFNRRQVVGS